MTIPVVGLCAAFETARWGFWNQPAAVISATYLAKIHASGGLAIGLIPDDRVAEDPHLVLDRIDGLMLIGGVDLEPDSYGAAKTARTEATAPERDRFEIALAGAAIERDFPVFGICRGMQVLNVATGGTLHEHLLDAGYTEHRPSPGRLDSATFHDVEVDAGTLAASLIGAGVQTVNSHHHQGVNELGQGAVASARSIADGLPEALEWPACTYVLGVQWHPEFADLQHVMSDFIAAAANVSRKGSRA
ncbi:gamma-glutamyl-gamma-aminobutyrate hydrolase family protein (plasmid) [Mycobacterium sp. TJFP1]